MSDQQCSHRAACAQHLPFYFTSRCTYYRALQPLGATAALGACVRGSRHLRRAEANASRVRAACLATHLQTGLPAWAGALFSGKAFHACRTRRLRQQCTHAYQEGGRALSGSLCQCWRTAACSRLRSQINVLVAFHADGRAGRAWWTLISPKPAIAIANSTTL